METDSPHSQSPDDGREPVLASDRMQVWKIAHELFQVNEPDDRIENRLREWYEKDGYNRDIPFTTTVLGERQDASALRFRYTPRQRLVESVSISVC